MDGYPYPSPPPSPSPVRSPPRLLSSVPVCATPALCRFSKHRCYPPPPLPAQALKLYGEPWKDIFFDNAAVLTPCWVLAAPLVQDGKKLGAVLWLSSCRWAGRGGHGG